MLSLVILEASGGPLWWDTERWTTWAPGLIQQGSSYVLRGMTPRLGKVFLLVQQRWSRALLTKAPPVAWVQVHHLRRDRARLPSPVLEKQENFLHHTKQWFKHSVHEAPVASGSWNNTQNFIIIHWFSFQHSISFESNGNIKSYLWGQPQYSQGLTRYRWRGGKKLPNTADQYLVSPLQPSADIKYIYNLYSYENNNNGSGR